MGTDIVDALPFELWQRCIAYACQGDNYMANLLKLTMVSRRWCQLLTETPTFWATIHVNDTDEDSLATITVFIHLSREVRLSLRIWLPLSEAWDTIYPIVLPHRNRIHAITLDTESKSHLPECTSKNTISDAHIRHNLQHIFRTLNFPNSVEYLDVILDHPVRMESIWLPSTIVSVGNWLAPLGILKPACDSPPRLRHLSIGAVDLVDFFPYLSASHRLQTLHLHSDEDDYLRPPPPPIKLVSPLRLPFLTTLRYGGRLHWVSTQLLNAVTQTVQRLELHIGIVDLGGAIQALEVSKSLRHFSLTLLMLENDIGGSNQRRSSKIKIPKWRLARLEHFRCEAKSPGNVQVAGNLDSDHLWQTFHTIFPRLHSLVWNLPISSGALLISLIRQKRLRHFESSVVSAPFSRQPTGFVLPTLESLRVKDSQMLRGVTIANLLHFSATFLEDFIIPTGFTFERLYSLDLTISESVEGPCAISTADFPALKLLAITFLGPRCHLQPLNLPSLTEIAISTRSPTFTQGMEFCVSLICEPQNCPRLEQITLDSFLDWNILYLFLWRRNFLQHALVSRIKRLGLPLLPPKFYPTFVSLLKGRHVFSLHFLWSLMTQMSIQGAQSRLLDQQVIGCFCCVQLGLADCSEPLHASRLPEEYSTSATEENVFSDVIEPLSLFPLYNCDLAGPAMPTFSTYENIWVNMHRKGAEEWRNAAYAWSKLRHRTLMCHKQLCSPKVMITEDGDGSGSHSPLHAPFDLGDQASLRDALRVPIEFLIELLRDHDWHLRSGSASTLVQLAAHEGSRDAIRPGILSLIELLKDQYSEVQSAAISALAGLANHVEFHDAICPAIPVLVEVLIDGHHDVQPALISALAELVQYPKLRDTFQVSIMVSLENMHNGVRPDVISTISKLAEHMGLRDAVRFIEPLKDQNPNIRSAATSALVDLATHAEFRNTICVIVPLFIRQLKDRHPYVRLATTSALSKLQQHVNLRDAIRPAIPRFIELLSDPNSDVGSAATSALLDLAVHVEHRDAIGAAMITLLNDRDHTIRSDAISALSKLSKYAKLHDLIQPAIPLLIGLLQDPHWKVTMAANSALVQLAVHAELRGAVRFVIIGVLKVWRPNIITSSTLVMLAQYLELRDVIRPGISQFVGFLTSEHEEVASADLFALGELAMHVELYDLIQPVVPFLRRLKSKDQKVQSSAAYVLGNLAKAAKY